MSQSTFASDVLTTRACRLLEIEHPIVQAGMAYIAYSKLAAAVSNAGGLGVIGSTGSLTPAQLRDEIRQVKASTSNPFAVNLLFPQYDDSPAGLALAQDNRDKIDVILDEDVPVLAAGLGLPAPEVIAACRQTGTRTMATIGTPAHAAAAERLGIDIVVAQGWEAGGHNSRIASMALLPQVCAAVDIPVLAAGGIAGGSGLVAALALGAAGVLIGTAFAVSAEAHVHDNYRGAVFAATESSTIISRAYSGKPLRMLVNEFSKHYDAHPEEVESFPQQWMKNEQTVVTACVDGDLASGPLPTGQIAGMLRSTETAAELIERIIAEATAVLDSGLVSR